MSNEKQNEKKVLTIKIETTLGTWENSFDKTAKIKEVITAIINHYNYDVNGNYELRPANDPDIVMDPERPLVSYHVKDGDILVFTDLGTAV